jgi:hypothetical protein
LGARIPKVAWRSLSYELHGTVLTDMAEMKVNEEHRVSLYLVPNNTTSVTCLIHGQTCHPPGPIGLAQEQKDDSRNESGWILPV